MSRQARLRPAVEADAADLLALYLAVDEADVGHPDSDEADVLWRWKEPAFDPVLDSFVAEDGGEIVGYAVVMEGEAEVFVHPAARGTGLGSLFVGAVERRAADRGDSPDGNIRQNVTSRNAAGHELLRRHGYEESHHYARMEIMLSERPEPPPVPEGITLRRFLPGKDERAIYEAEVAAWTQYPRFRDPGFERWSNVFEEADFDAELWLVATEGDRIVAFSQNAGYPDLGWIQNLSTIPEARNRGLGELLVKTTFQLYWDRGISRVGLTVSSERAPAVRRLYERCGMQEVLRYTNYRKPLPD